MKWLILILGVTSNASASALIKMAVSSPLRKLSVNDPLSILTNVPLLAGVALYGLAFVLYAAALHYLPLNIAHPVLTSGSIALVSLISVVAFGEKLAISSMLGIGLILVGVVVLTMK
ncbi:MULTISPECIES: multidrug efflux SMR transporter [unclassified Salinivibrio]|uniref:DMT family transporter n=1 Tax=unclassified Salinivibrio TaxID=2636825 RepID=UPI0009893079|nr:MULTISPECIES: SMR family transporter [unclassified Salinivibrio]OOF19755.1 multidrug transporter [Salinivibrio sp. IB574]PCE67656.1 multidrug transporter [Salinivibrio sp. YCSC6]QCF35444.1 multidrug transporter [Salinivibrio sp. YCSC6]